MAHRTEREAALLQARSQLAPIQAKADELAAHRTKAEELLAYFFDGPYGSDLEQKIELQV